MVYVPSRAAYISLAGNSPVYTAQLTTGIQGIPDRFESEAATGERKERLLEEEKAFMRLLNVMIRPYGKAPDIMDNVRCGAGRHDGHDVPTGLDIGGEQSRALRLNVTPVGQLIESLWYRPS